MDGSTNQSIYSINNTIGVATVVYCGWGALSIPQTIIDELQSRADKHGEIPMSQKGKPEFPGQPGDKVQFKTGSPFEGLIAVLQGVDKTGKLVVELENSMGPGRITTAHTSVDLVREEPIPANGGSLGEGEVHDRG